MEEIKIENKKNIRLCGVWIDRDVGEESKNVKKRQTNKNINSDVLNTVIEVDDDWLNEELFVAIRLATASQDGPLSQPIRIKINVEEVKRKYVLVLHEVGSNHVLFSWAPKPSPTHQPPSLDHHNKYFIITLMDQNKHIVSSVKVKYNQYKTNYFYKILNLHSSHEYTLKINSKENEKLTKFKHSKSNVASFKTTSPTQGLDSPTVKNIKLFHQNHFSFTDNQIYDDVIISWFSSSPLSSSSSSFPSSSSSSSASNLLQNPPSEYYIQYKPANLMGESSWTSVHCHMMLACQHSTQPRNKGRNDLYPKNELLTEYNRDKSFKETVDSKIVMKFYNTSYNDIINRMQNNEKDTNDNTNFDVDGLFYWAVVSIPRLPDSAEDRIYEFRVVGVSVLETCAQSIVYSEAVTYNMASMDDSFLHSQMLSTTWAVVGIIIIFVSVFIIVVIITILLASGNKHIYLVGRKEKSASKQHQGMKVLLDSHSNNHTYRQTLPAEDEDETKGGMRDRVDEYYEKENPNENNASRNYNKTPCLKSTFYGDIDAFENNGRSNFMEKSTFQRTYKNVTLNEEGNCYLDEVSRYNTLCLSTTHPHETNGKVERNNSLTDPKTTRQGLKKNKNMKDGLSKNGSIGDKTTLEGVQTKSFSKHNALVLDTLV